MAGINEVVISPKVETFYKHFFPNVGRSAWLDWRWQLRASIRTAAELERCFSLNNDERAALERYASQNAGGLPTSITPYYASLMSREDPMEPLRRTHIPVAGEYLRMPGEADDPLGEDQDTAAPGIVHRYPDRVLFLVNSTCATYCRYCTRSRLVGQVGGENQPSTRRWEAALAYIAAHPEVRDVLLSGGDPLTIGDEKLDWLLGRLRAIPHVELIRIGTKVPVVLPMRITPQLTEILQRHRLDLVSLHFTHPTELTLEATQALARLHDSRVMLGSQTVLLKGINDNIETMKTLFHGLLHRHVRPYYLYQCDPITGSSHFRTTVAKGLEIIEGLRGHTSGYAVPTYVIDAPGGGGKIPLQPNYVVGRNSDGLILRNYKGEFFNYPDPQDEEG